MATISRFLISAIASGSGKTTVTLGLLRALKNRGLSCQPFKCGPDYIDTKFHERASSKEAVNLDLFLSSGAHLKELFNKYSAKSDVSIVEGVMGLFDGYDRMEGSSAQIGELLNLPVILVVNAKSMAYSLAPLLYGFKHFYDRVSIAGVILNFVSTESHYLLLKEACKEVGIEVLGYLPKDDALEIPSRHLGLRLDPSDSFDSFAERVAGRMEKYIEVDRLLSLTRMEVRREEVNDVPVSGGKRKIAIASDEAFNFMYHENKKVLERLGTVIFFSPLKDTCLPDADFVYLPGGYPELFLKELSQNRPMMDSIREYAESGGFLLAECGGMMYLSSSITDREGGVYPMVGLFRQKASMELMKLKLGYRRFEYGGVSLRGHEFHYSTLESDLKSVCAQQNAKGQPVDTKLLRYKNVIAGYTHLYWGERGTILDLFNGKQE